MLELKDLRFFVAVYEEGSFTKAASRLATVQSAVSDRIRRLERDLGAPLFLRYHRAITPTQKGKLLHDHAKRVLVQVGDLEMAIRAEKRRKSA